MKLHPSYAIIVFAVTALYVPAAMAGDAKAAATPKHFSAGIEVSGKPRVEETGLPLYQGATLEREAGDDDGGVNLNLWIHSFGFKLVAMKLKTPDSAEKVEAFYRAALAQHGEVLDCSDAASKRKTARSERAAYNVLTCDDLQMTKSGLRDGKLFKAGTRTNQYGVSVQTKGNMTTFQLFHFEKRGGDE